MENRGIKGFIQTKAHSGAGASKKHDNAKLSEVGTQVSKLRASAKCPYVKLSSTAGPAPHQLSVRTNSPAGDQKEEYHDILPAILCPSDLPTLVTQ